MTSCLRADMSSSDLRADRRLLKALSGSSLPASTADHGAENSTVVVLAHKGLGGRCPQHDMVGISIANSDFRHTVEDSMHGLVKAALAERSCTQGREMQPDLQLRQKTHFQAVGIGSLFRPKESCSPCNIGAHASIALHVTAVYARH